MFPHLFRVLKDGGFLVLWCDIMNWTLLYNSAVSAGFGVQRWPIVWHKTSSCLNQMAHVNITTKHRTCNGVSKRECSFADSGRHCVIDAATADTFPTPLLSHWTSGGFSTIPSPPTASSFLDPFAGEGSSTVAAMKCQRRSLAIECDPTHYPYLVTNVKDYWTKVFQKVRFV